MHAKCPIRLYFSPKSYGQMKTFWGHRGPKSGTCEGPKMHMYGQMRAYWSNSMHSSVFHPFPMKQANWLVMAPKGLFMAKWGHFGAIRGPNWGSFRVKLLSNGSSNMHSSVVVPYFTKHKPTGWFKTREAPKLTLRAKWGSFGLTYQTWKWWFLKIGL